MTEAELRAVAFDLLCDAVKPYHQRGMTWQIQASRLRNQGGAGRRERPD